MPARPLVRQILAKAPPWVSTGLEQLWRTAKSYWRGIDSALGSTVISTRSLKRFHVRKRVLGIYHFQEHAGFLGDMVEFLAVLNILKAERGAEKVDLCHIDDAKNPNRPVSRGRVDSSPAFKEMMVQLH